MQKTIKENIASFHGMKVNLARAYTRQDAVNEFIKGITAAGGRVGFGANHDELEVSGSIKTNTVEKLTLELEKNLRSALSPLDKALKNLGDAVQQRKQQASEFVVASVAVTPEGLQLVDVQPEKLVYASFATLQAPREVPINRAKNKESIKTRASKYMSSGNFKAGQCPSLAGAVFRIVGQHHQSVLAQKVLSSKKIHNKILLVAEPDNQVDKNAVMVMVWNTDPDNQGWIHTGYLPREQASSLRKSWPEKDEKLALVAYFSKIPFNPDGRRHGNNIQLTLDGEVRYYPDFYHSAA